MEQNMSPQDAEFVEKTTLAGMKIMYDKEAFKSLRAGLTKEGVEIPKRLATETAGLMKLLMDKSGGKMPRQIIIPVARRLLLDMALFMLESGIAKPSGEEISQADAMLVELLQKVFPRDGSNQPQQTPQQTPQQAPQSAPQQMPPQPARSGGLLTQGV